MNHTPTPWKVFAGTKTFYLGDGKRIIAESIHDSIYDEADFAYMAEACTNYERVKSERDELLAAVSALADLFALHVRDAEKWFTYRAARAAIAKAEAR
jgi:hypothetical protein